MGVFQTLHRANQVVLNVKRQTGADTVGVILVGGQAFGFQKDLVTVFVCKAVDLVFHARAIAWADAFDLAGEHGAAIKARTDDVVGALVGVRNPTRHVLRVHGRTAHEAKHRHLAQHTSRRCAGGRLVGNTVTWLFGALAEVNGASVDAWWRAGFQTALWELQFFQTRRQTDGRWVARAAARVVVQPNVNLAV